MVFKDIKKNDFFFLGILGSLQQANKNIEQGIFLFQIFYLCYY